jgi:hypothetical protein
VGGFVEWGKWTHIAMSQEILTLILSQNGAELDRDDMETHFIDDRAYFHVLGAGFTGYVYEICFYTFSVHSWANIDLDSSCTDDVECDVCPLTDQTICLSTCPLDTYIGPDKQCLACSDDCATGCLREHDCRSCLELLCEDCTHWETEAIDETCNACVDNAEVDATSKVCECTGDTVYFTELEECGECSAHCLTCNSDQDCTDCEDGYYLDTDSTPVKCTKCSSECSSCTGGTPDSCQDCNLGYFKLPNTDICGTTCPTMTSYDFGESTCDDTTEQSVCFEFDSKVFELDDQGTGVELVSLSSYQDPVPVYERGFYFSASSSFAVSNLVLNTKFSLEFYVRCEAAGSLLEIV